MQSASLGVTRLSSQPQAYLQQAQDLVILESIILQTLGKFFKRLPHESQTQECPAEPQPHSWRADAQQEGSSPALFSASLLLLSHSPRCSPA